MSQTVGEIQKNALEKIIAALGEYQGKQRIDIRTYFLPNPAQPDNWVPTKKGINLNIENWEELKDLIEKIDQTISNEVQRD